MVASFSSPGRSLGDRGNAGQADQADQVDRADRADRAGSSGRRRPRLAAVVALLAGVALLGLAVPRVVAAGLVLPHETLVARLAAGESLVLPELAPAIRAHEAALDWHASARLYQRLGQLRLAAARATTLEAERRRLREAAARAHEAAVARNPALGYAWFQLAVLRLELDGPGPAFARAFARSVAVAPAAPAPLFARVRLGLGAWPRLDPDSRRLLGAQVALAAEIDPQRLLETVSGANRRALLRRLLAERPDLLARLDALLTVPRAQD